MKCPFGLCVDGCYAVSTLVLPLKYPWTMLELWSKAMLSSGLSPLIKRILIAQCNNIKTITIWYHYWYAGHDHFIIDVDLISFPIQINNETWLFMKIMIIRVPSVDFFADAFPVVWQSFTGALTLLTACLSFRFSRLQFFDLPEHIIAW
jgi:hypothetical protein